MAEKRADLVASIEVPLKPRRAFEGFVEDLSTGLTLRGLRFVPGPRGQVIQAGRTVGRVRGWEPGTRILLEWHAIEWEPARTASLEIRFEPIRPGTRISLRYLGWRETLTDVGEDLAGWFAHQVAAPLVDTTTPARIGDWITDRRARRPSGASGRQTHRDPKYQRPNFKLLPKTLALTREDFLLEVGCGGGAFLHDALASGCRAAAIDHSPEMVRLAREVNREAVEEGRLEVVEADAESIPYAAGRFSCAVTTGVFGFIPNPSACLAEIHRVLAPGGRLALFTGTRELAGTPAAPEPMASRIHFYEDDELRRLGHDAGFVDVQVDRPSLEPFAREAGLSEEDVAFFRGMGGAQILTARRT